MDSQSLPFSRYGLLLPEQSPYRMTLSEIEAAFGRSTHARRNIFDGFARGVSNLMEAGVERIVVGGSFVSQKREPGDADIAWWFNPDIDWQKLDPVFQVPERRAARGKFLLDQRIDGIEEVPYEWSHEAFLRTNNRMPVGHQAVGIVQVALESGVGNRLTGI